MPQLILGYFNSVQAAIDKAVAVFLLIIVQFKIARLKYGASH